MKRTFSPGGIKLPHYKLTSRSPIVDLELPRRVVLPLSQHIGRMSVPAVGVGDVVVRGQLVATADGFVSASLHTPITGVVKSVGSVPTSYGRMADAIIVEADDKQHEADMAMIARGPHLNRELTEVSADDIVKMVRDAGIVGLGGATFPTSVKLTPPVGSTVDVLVVNGAECEPYLTCDHALMLGEPEGIIWGVRAVMKALCVKRAIIGVEDNKADAIASLREAAGGAGDVAVTALRTRYPQGGEKQLICALTGRRVPSGKLPADVGVVVVNVATAYAVMRAVRYGEPLMERVVTVTGKTMRHPGNYRVAIGYSVDCLMKMSNEGSDVPVAKTVFGGPMMGHAVSRTDVPVVKGLSGVVTFSADEALRRRPDPCVRCGRCVEACPMGLEPYLLSTLSRAGEIETAASHRLMDCVECGSCSYVCPSARPILDFIREGKRELKKQNI